MNITIIGRGRVGGGLARMWQRAGHQVTTIGREGGDASGADVVVVSVPGNVITEALSTVTGLDGQVTIDTTNLYTERDETFPSLSHRIKAVVGGPTAKSFSTVFASAYDDIATQRVTPSSLYAAEPGAKDITEQLIRDAGLDPLYVGDLDPGARLLENSSALTRALAGQIGPFFYRYGRPGEL
ncbi:MULTISPECIES: NADH-ubiquinone oxidoreductase [Streptomyces]|uniref:NADH-ubiquinone oxidoreductase n=1 Tax=Streptomyces viridochromogenes TaxID=1938 RepID=A0A0L8JET7_STRVR|nr:MULTISPECIES: NADH-ubiquinone oxidoreductase [Streptomyces]KOG12131.1 NADH-ubiquinone oxidoreductase [Streptomyces viridochromogenes]